MQETENTTKRKADELFEQIKAGDQKALEHLFAVYFPRLNDFAKKVVKDGGISEDIVQEVFVKVWESRAEIEVINLEAYLFRLVRNRCIDYIKHLRVVNNRMHEIQIESKYEELYRIDFMGDEPYLLIENERNINEGLKLIDRALKSKPDDYLLIDTKGWGFHKLGKNKEALELLEKSDSLKPMYDHILFLHIQKVKKVIADLK